MINLLRAGSAPTWRIFRRIGRSRILRAGGEMVHGPRPWQVQTAEHGENKRSHAGHLALREL
jgi:hypothetical protein